MRALLLAAALPALLAGQGMPTAAPDLSLIHI